MKIKTAEMSYEDVCNLKPEKHRRPKRPNMVFRTLLKVLSAGELKKVHFTCRKTGMERLGKKEPCLILMNHSSFIDLKIASTLLYPRPFNIVCTSDGFVGKGWLMRQLGCIPTQKFVSDLTLIRDIVYAVKKKKNSVLMYPEASYSFDGTTTPLPDSLGPFLKMLGVPVVMITTYGAFARDPLYNNLQLRQVDVSAEMTYLLSPEEIKQKTPDELNAILAQSFSLDYFRWQQQKGIHITEDFRADHLNRVLYQCPHCMTEGCMVGKGTTLRCENCGKTYELTEDGFLRPLAGEAAFTHVPDWYRWEREQVRASLLAGTYRLDIPVDICMMVNDKCIYRVGEGRLVHTCAGFHLTGCNGALDYKQKPNTSYGLYADYYWYELGDVICIGYDRVLYYCFPKGGCDVVAKTRLAVEELYKMERQAATQKRRARSAMPAES